MIRPIAAFGLVIVISQCHGQHLAIKALLEGSSVIANSLMRDELRTNGLIPLNEPYSQAGYGFVGGGGESIAASVLSTSGPNAIVDWVVVEARDTSNFSLVWSRCALIQRDGDVVDLDGTSRVSMPITPGYYHVALRHRNHLPIRTSCPLFVADTAFVDWTDPATETCSPDARKVVFGIPLLWAGNVVMDDVVRYTGSTNDRDPILNRIGGVVATNSVQGYYPEDVNMDGVVLYSGSNNDRDPILQNIGGIIPTSVLGGALGVGCDVCTTIVAPPFVWTQVGADIDGEAAMDLSGYSVALSDDGFRVAIGALYNDGNGTDAGHVRLYDWNGSNWVQVGGDIDGEAAGDWSGYSVALSADGSRVAIGALLNDGGGTQAGHVRIYDWNGLTWVQVGADIDGEAAFDNSGNAVAISADGNRVAIGASFNLLGQYAGYVRLYDWNGSNWVQVGVDIDGQAYGDEAGFSVALSADGNRVAIGAPMSLTDGLPPNGQVRLFDWNGLAWVQVGSDIDGELAASESGSSVALSADGNRVAIGAPLNWEYGGGHVRIYDWNGLAWVQVGVDIDAEAFNDDFGCSVALSADGSRVAIGARLNDGGGTDAGHVRLYDWNGSNWVQVGGDIDGEAAGDSSGYSVALSADGSRVVIGAVNNDGNGAYAGQVRVYE